MMNSSDVKPLTPEIIQHLLDSQARAEMPVEYVRLMEIYCVVKAGGVEMQMAVARQLESKERATLTEAILELTGNPEQAGRIPALQQEIAEVERSVANRLAYLQSIAPEEEAIVRRCLPLIDQYFAGLGQAHE